MTRSIYFVRHTEYQDPDKLIPGRLPVPLSEFGRQQAEKLKVFFFEKQISKIYSSAVLRCQQTSEIIAAGQIPIVNDLRILEVITSYQGFTFREGEDWSHFYGHRKELGGEGFPEIQARMLAFFEEIKSKNEGNILVVSHGDPLYLLNIYLAKKPLPKEEDVEKNRCSEDYPEKGSIRELVIDSLTSWALTPFHQL